MADPLRDLVHQLGQALSANPDNPHAHAFILRHEAMHAYTNYCFTNLDFGSDVFAKHLLAAEATSARLEARHA